MNTSDNNAIRIPQSLEELSLLGADALKAEWATPRTTPRKASPPATIALSLVLLLVLGLGLGLQLISASMP